MELLEAFSLLRDKYSRLHLLLVGGLDASEGSDKKFVDELKDKIDNLGLIYAEYMGSGGATTDVNYNTSTGEIYQVTSSQRYKENISEYTDSILEKVISSALAISTVYSPCSKPKSETNIV